MNCCSPKLSRQEVKSVVRVFEILSMCILKSPRRMMLGESVHRWDRRELISGMNMLLGFGGR